MKGSELDRVLAGLAEKFGVAVEDLFPVLVSHAYVQACVTLVVLVVAVVGIVALVPLVHRLSAEMAKNVASYDKSTALWIPRILVWSAAAIAIPIFLGELPRRISDVMYPEAAVIRSLLGG